VSAIALDHLSKTYVQSHLGRQKKTLGVEDLNLHVQEGEVFGLLGLNGSGKTTTIKLILGLLFPSTGSVKVFGQAISDRATKSRIGYLPEVPYFYKFLSPREVLRFYARLSGISEKEISERIEKVLAQVRMVPHADRMMREFSKGMLQRVGIAQSILHDPDILILDEPVTGIDPLGLREMRNLLEVFSKRGKTLFFSSHSISEVERICHRVGILVRGRLVKIVNRNEWMGEGGKLEDIFVETISQGGNVPVT